MGEYLLRDIRDSDVVPVIENYRTSAISSSFFEMGDAANEFNKRTVFSELKPWFYGSTQLSAKHNVAVPMYMHCQKWREFGPLNDNAPSCRMSTAELQQKCPIENWRDECSTRYVQIGDDAAFTTPDYDDRFEEFAVETSVSVPRPTFSYKLISAETTVIVTGLIMLGLIVMFCAMVILRKNKKVYAPVKFVDSENESDMELL